MTSGVQEIPKTKRMRAISANGNYGLIIVPGMRLNEHGFVSEGRLKGLGQHSFGGSDVLLTSVRRPEYEKPLLYY